MTIGIQQVLCYIHFMYATKSDTFFRLRKRIERKEFYIIEIVPHNVQKNEINIKDMSLKHLMVYRLNRIAHSMNPLPLMPNSLDEKQNE